MSTFKTTVARILYINLNECGSIRSLGLTVHAIMASDQNNSHTSKDVSCAISADRN